MSPRGETPPECVDTEPQTITFHYIKGTRHHVAHVDGVYCDITPQGSVAMSLFSERFPIPNETTHSMIEGAVKGQPDEIKGKKGIVREIDVTAVLIPDAARKIGELLVAKANEAEQRTKKAHQQGGK